MKREKKNPSKACLQCGAPFYYRDGPTSFYRKKFCNKECMGLSYRHDIEKGAAAFWSRVDKGAGPDQCWPYRGAITTHGYGCTNWQGRILGSHKIAYMLTKGEVALGLEIRHSCDNRRCCNPAHLSTGTRQDNMDDKVARGRTPKTHKRILNVEAVREIRRLRGSVSSGEIAKRFGITQSHTFTIWAGRCWKGIQ